MKNKKQNDMLILSNLEQNVNRNEKIAIVINLYYEENLDCYLEYVKNVPDSIDIYFFSSNEKIVDYLKKKFVLHDFIYIHKKENRGRDISALLVAFRPFIRQYSYLCFLHDKKEKCEYLKEDVEFWCENLWGNMIFSEKYIAKAIELMKNNHYGFLMPPKPIGKFIDTMYVNAWGDNFDNVVLLAQKIGLNILITREDEDLLSIGSVFWCDVDALDKLFTYDWTYESFVQEPLPNDGTISHAIERIFGFVALDAGYKIGTIINVEYASKLNSILQKKLYFTYDWMKQKLGVNNSYQLEMLDLQQEKVIEIYKRTKNVYLYGVGYYGKIYLKRFRFWGYTPKGFVVSDGERKEEKFGGIQIYELHEIQDYEDMAIIIAVGSELTQEIVNNLKKAGVSNYYIL